MTTLIYAGIGARATPGPVLADMTKMAAWLARTGWHLATGAARGADTAFAAGAPAGRRTLYLPWPGYNGHGGPNCHVPSPAALDASMLIAARLHPAWHRCSPAVRKLHARNASVILGTELDRPVECRRVLERRRRHQRRHRVGASHRGRAQCSGAEPRRPYPACGLRAAAGHPARFLNLLRRSSKSAAERRASARLGRGRRPHRPPVGRRNPYRRPRPCSIPTLKC